MKEATPKCPFKEGMKVRFSPNNRTKGLYQNIEGFGLTPGGVYKIKEIKDGIYLYFEEGGGWPWNAFQPMSLKNHSTSCWKFDGETL
jgi:hypothetical protein